MKRWPIIVLIILLLAGGGWYFWDKHNKNDSSSLSPPSNSQIQGGYIVIKEWGVRMKLNDTIKDAHYTFNSQYNSLEFTTDSIKNIPGCESTTSVFTVQRALNGEPLGATIASDKDVPPMVKVSNYYYLDVGPAYNCGQGNKNIDDSNRVGSEKIGQIQSSFNEAFKTLQEVPSS